jgi:hypothetical protein
MKVRFAIWSPLSQGHLCFWVLQHPSLKTLPGPRLSGLGPMIQITIYYSCLITTVSIHQLNWNKTRISGICRLSLHMTFGDHAAAPP